MMTATMTQVRAAQPNWFSRSNKRFFGDVWYRLYHGKVSRKPFMVRATFAWSDMFGRQKTLHYRVNEVNAETLQLGNLVDKSFRDLDDVKEWLREQ